jgi:serine O-acetyltransferase
MDIHPNATIGKGILFDHASGLVVGETSQIGSGCSLMHNVTLGSILKEG